MGGRAFKTLSVVRLACFGVRGLVDMERVGFLALGGPMMGVARGLRLRHGSIVVRGNGLAMRGRLKRETSSEER